MPRVQPLPTVPAIPGPSKPQLQAALFCLGLMGLLLLSSLRQPPSLILPASLALRGPARVEINTADSAAFEALPRIGPATARRILRYRAAVGIFYELGQLRRVYGLDTIWAAISPYLYIDESALPRLELNAADTTALARLPGIGRYTARRIVNYRQKIGGFRRMSQFRKVYGMDTLYPRIARWVYLAGQPPDEEATLQDLYFDPPADLNTVTEAQLLRARLFPKAFVRTLLKYRTAAGGFDSLGHTRRLYGITDLYYQRILANFYLNPPPDTSLAHFAYQLRQDIGYNRPPPEPLDLNGLDTIALASLPRIGPALAARIVQYRTELGFYHSLAQLTEVYGLPDSALPDLKQWLYVKADQRRYRHLPINTATAEQLAAHPYIKHSLARRIIRYRQQHGPYQTLADLSNIDGIPPETWQQLAPYVVFE